MLSSFFWVISGVEMIYRVVVASLVLLLGMSAATAQENASNPLASVNSVDFRWNYFSADTGDTQDIWIDGAQMLGKKLKLKYELHYKITDITGTK